MKLKFTPHQTAALCAVLAALLYALNAPLSKLLLSEVSPFMMAALLYLGAGIGAVILIAASRRKPNLPLRSSELPYTFGMIALDVAAPILLMLGLTTAAPENVSLLNNFEIVATTLIALLLFREAISKKLALAITLVTLSSIILSFEGSESLTFGGGSLFVLAACTCWGLENNCTRKISDCDPLGIVAIKGSCSGTVSLVIALAKSEALPHLTLVFAALILGFVAYGLSIAFYVYAQRTLGAARTSAYYAIAPFLGAALSLLIFRDLPPISFFIALPIMIAGTVYMQ